MTEKQWRVSDERVGRLREMAKGPLPLDKGEIPGVRIGLLDTLADLADAKAEIARLEKALDMCADRFADVAGVLEEHPKNIMRWGSYALVLYECARRFPMRRLRRERRDDALN